MNGTSQSVSKREGRGKSLREGKKERKGKEKKFLEQDAFTLAEETNVT